VKRLAVFFLGMLLVLMGNWKFTGWINL
jgi:hypothetical protein